MPFIFFPAPAPPCNLTVQKIKKSISFKPEVTCFQCFKQRGKDFCQKSGPGKGHNQLDEAVSCRQFHVAPFITYQQTTDKGNPEFPGHLPVSFIWQLITYVETSFMSLLRTTIQFSFVHALASQQAHLPHTLKMTSRSRMKPSNDGFQ